MASTPETGWTDISEAVFFHARQRPDAVALIEGAERVSYGAFAPLVAAAAAHIRDLGVAPREVVGVVMPGTIDHVVLSLALIRVGAVPLELPMPQDGEGTMPIMLHFGVRRAFVAAGVRPPGATPPDGLLVHEIDAGWRGTLPIGCADRRAAGTPDEDFYLSLTSGSTGLPKGIVTTRRQWQARYNTARKLFPFLLSPENPPHLLVVGGMAFSAFFFFLANHLFAGGPVVLMTGAHQPDRLAAAINEWDDAAMMLTPPVAREFLARAPGEGVMFPRLRALFIGAAPFFAAEKRAARDRLSPNCYEVYGSAASGFLSSLAPLDIEAHGDSTGRPVEDVEIEIVDHEGGRVPPGRTGHIRVRGPGISKGFYRETPGETAGGDGFRQGWYYPGDLGAFDDGYLRLKGRLGDVIRRRGVEIYPPDLEEVYLAHPAIREAAVVGAAEPGGGPDRRVIVFAVADAGLQARELTQHCRCRIPPERFPDQLFCLAQLPRTGNGKVDRPRLVAMAEQALARTGQPAA